VCGFDAWRAVSFHFQFAFGWQVSLVVTRFKILEILLWDFIMNDDIPYSSKNIRDSLREYSKERGSEMSMMVLGYELLVDFIQGIRRVLIVNFVNS
jgi:hypothetical protein